MIRIWMKMIKLRTPGLVAPWHALKVENLLAAIQFCPKHRLWNPGQLWVLLMSFMFSWASKMEVYNEVTSTPYHAALLGPFQSCAAFWTTPVSSNSDERWKSSTSFPRRVTILQDDDGWRTKTQLGTRQYSNPGWATQTLPRHPNWSSEDEGFLKHLDLLCGCCFASLPGFFPFQKPLWIQVDTGRLTTTHSFWTSTRTSNSMSCQVHFWLWLPMMHYETYWYGGTVWIIRLLVSSLFESQNLCFLHLSKDIASCKDLQFELALWQQLIEKGFPRLRVEAASSRKICGSNM